VRSVVKKIVCNDRIIALKLKAEPVDILIIQVYMPTSEYEDDEVEKVYDTIEEILCCPAYRVITVSSELPALVLHGKWFINYNHLVSVVETGYRVEVR
jgi:hypothetical protein